MANDKLNKISPEQLAYLEKFTDNFRTANEAGWSRLLPSGAEDKLLEIVIAATGKPYPYHRGCAACAVGLLRDASKVYRAMKELEAAEAEKAAEVPAESEQPSAEVTAPVAASKTAAAKKTSKKPAKK